MVDGWFPRLSPDGRHVASGAQTISVDGVEIGPGVQPVWLTAESVLWRDRDDVRLHTWNLQSQQRTAVELPSGCNLIDANGRGQWVGWFAGYRPTRVRTSDGWEFADAYGPTISPTGDVAYTDGAGRLWAYGAVVGTNARCPRWTTAGLVWLEEHARHQPRVASVNGWARAINLAHLAVACATPKGPVLVVLEDDRLIAYVASEEHGWIVADGETFHPDAAWAVPDAAWADGRLRVAWSSGRGEPCERSLDLNEPTVPLRRAAPVDPPTILPPDPPVEPPMPDYRTFTWNKCHVHRDAPDIGAWPVTSTPTFVIATVDGEVIFEHTKAGQWPVVPYETIVVEGAIWTIAPDGDGWRAATWDRLRPGQTTKAITAGDYQQPYALDLPGWVPKAGDVVGYLVSTPARMDERGPRNERSPIAWVLYGAETGPLALEGAPDVSEPPVTPPSDDLAALNARVAVLTVRVADLEAWARSFR